MTQFAAVLFDLDGTLCRHDQSAETVYSGAFEAAGVEPFGDPDHLWAALDGPPDPDDQAGYLADGFARVADRHDRSVDADALARGFLAVVDYSAVSFRPGAWEALEMARDRGAVGLLTNGPRERQSVKLEALGIDDAFDVTVFAGDLPRRKPHREPFDRALARLDVAAARALYVGDSLEYDVAGAHAAGLQAAWCPEDDVNGSAHEAYRPEFILDSLAELPTVLG